MPHSTTIYWATTYPTLLELLPEKFLDYLFLNLDLTQASFKSRQLAHPAPTPPPPGTQNLEGKKLLLPSYCFSKPHLPHLEIKTPLFNEAYINLLYQSPMWLQASNAVCILPFTFLFKRSSKLVFRYLFLFKAFPCPTPSPTHSTVFVFPPEPRTCFV